jgi:O-antigen ligase
MTRTLIDKIILGLLLTIMGGIVLHTPVTLWLSTLLPEYELLIKSWKEILMGIAAVLLTVSVVKKSRLRELGKDKILLLAAAIAVLHVLYVIIFNNSQMSEFAGILIDLRFYLYFALVYSYLRLYPNDAKLFIATFFVGAAIVTVFALLQIFILPKDILASIGYSAQTIQPYLTVDLNEAYIRINSTLRGPNPLGAYAVIIICMIVAIYAPRFKAIARKKQAAVAVITIGALAALWWSYSRSAMLAFAVAACCFVVAVGIGTISKRVAMYTATVFVVVLAGLGAFVALNPEFVSSVVLHENQDGGSAHKSNDGHLSSLQEGLEQTADEPFGIGVGSTGSASLLGDNPRIVENQYLAMAHESGWFGTILQLLLFVVVLVTAWRNRKRPIALAVFTSGVGMAVIGLVLPVWTDDTVSIVWWGLAAIAIALSIPNKKSEDIYERTSHKKTKRIA